MRCGGAGLVVDDVRMNVEKNFVARCGLTAKGELVCHDAGWRKQSGFLAQKRCDALLQRVNGRIVSKDVVADFGVQHRLTHAVIRTRHRVATEIDRHDFQSGERRMRGFSAAPQPGP